MANGTVDAVVGLIPVVVATKITLDVVDAAFDKNRKQMRFRL